jgi:quercetin dioxygenase-like cupin family protein
MAIVQYHEVVPFESQGNLMRGLATPMRGAQQIEVWQGTIASGAATPPHVHEGEEVVVISRGQGELRVGETSVPFAGPCTLIAPAGVAHQILNTGEEPLELVAALPLGSKVATPAGEELTLPWRT